ncbi:MAG: FAD-dependent oxidoreductase [Polyangiaceae bacterium]
MAKSTKTSVLIVGAGVSGLGAARQLVDDDWEVIVLEGRNRIGGRTWSNRTWPGLALDMGAGWIEGAEENPVAAIANKAHINTATYDDETEYLYNSNGDEVEDDDAEAQEERFEAIMKDVETLRSKRKKAGEADVSLQALIDEVLPKHNLSDEQKKAFDYDITRVVESDYAEDSTKISGYHWDEGDGFDGEDLLFPEGYDQIAQTLAKGVDVRLEHKVEKIEYSEDGVKITTNHGVFEGDYALVTVPLGVLKKGVITFDPPLPKSKTNAIDKLGMGLLNRVYLRFPEVFWEKKPHGFGIIPKRRDEWTEFVNFYPFVHQPILLCFNSGDFARKVEKLSDADTVAGMMTALRGAFGKQIPEPTDYLISRWSQDPFAFGSYSYMAIGASPKDRAALAESVNDVLFFAGEATEEDYPGTVHGALLSGRRAADEIDEVDSGDEDEADDDDDEDEDAE